MAASIQGKAQKGALPKGDALANHLETATLAVRNAFCECPSYDQLVPALLAHGTQDLLQHVHFVAGTPIKAMLARPTNGVTEVLDKFSDCDFTCEYKYDGERAQVRAMLAAALSSTCAGHARHYPVMRRCGPCVLRPLSTDARPRREASETPTLQAADARARA